MAKTYRIGIIGYGKIAQDQHAPSIAANPRFQLAAVSNGGDAAPPDGARAFAGYAEMLSALPDLDAVAVCTPPGPRRAIAADCLAAGRHVLLEKPPAGTVAEVADIGARAKEAGKVAFTTYHAQHNAAVKAAADLLRGHTLKSLQVTWKEDVRRWHPGQEWVFAPGGFGVFDPGINALSILTRIAPEPLFVSEAKLHVPEGRQGPIAADLTLGTGRRKDEALSAVFDWRQTGDQTWTIAAQTHDGLQLTLSDGGARLETPGRDPLVGPPDEYPDIYREFADLLDAGTPRVDAAPFQLVADAFMIGARDTVAAFSF